MIDMNIKPMSGASLLIVLAACTTEIDSTPTPNPERELSMETAALETLGVESIGSNWPAWVEWYGGTDLAPPTGFTEWKGDLLNDLAFEGVINDQVGDTNVVLVASCGRVMVRGENLRVGEELYDEGGEVRAFDRRDEVFSTWENANAVTDSQGREWQVTEGAFLGPDGEVAPRIKDHLAYWFAFFPNTLVYGIEPG